MFDSTEPAKTLEIPQRHLIDHLPDLANIHASSVPCDWLERHPTHAHPSKNALVLCPSVARVIDSNQRLLPPINQLTTYETMQVFGSVKHIAKSMICLCPGYR